MLRNIINLLLWIPRIVLLMWLVYSVEPVFTGSATINNMTLFALSMVMAIFGGVGLGHMATFKDDQNSDIVGIGLLSLFVGGTLLLIVTFILPSDTLTYLPRPAQGNDSEFLYFIVWYLSALATGFVSFFWVRKEEPEEAIEKQEKEIS